GNRLAASFGIGEPLQGEAHRGEKRIGGVKVVDVDTGKELQTLELRPPPDFCAVAFSADGKRLATAPFYYSDYDLQGQKPAHAVQVWDIASGREVARFPIASSSSLE